MTRDVAGLLAVQVLMIGGCWLYWNHERVFQNLAIAHGSLPLLLRALTTRNHEISAPLRKEGNTMSNTKCSDECTLPAGHPGYHYDERSGMQWVGGPTNCEAGHPKFSLFECTLPAGHPGLHYDDVAGYHWAPSDMRRDGSRPKPREQWTFAGRYTGSDGTPYYVWNLKDERGRLNSSFVYPVALMIGTSWVDAREGE